MLWGFSEKFYGWFNRGFYGSFMRVSRFFMVGVVAGKRSVLLLGIVSSMLFYSEIFHFANFKKKCLNHHTPPF